ncbi:hypothetical protein MGN70_004646 [Eutypa lata]|nr:hypothetical protein MGN70_004646 [Eutypa lata]
MAQTKVQESDKAKIKLRDYEFAYVQGDVLKGHIVRTAAPAIQDAKITIRLVGRTKAGLRLPALIPAIGRASIAGWVPFWKEADFLSVEKTIHEGQIPAGDTAWSFNMPISKGQRSTEKLPPTYHYTSDLFVDRKRYYIFTEYVLEAQISSSSSTATALLPICVQWPSTPRPTSGFGMETRVSEHTFRSFHLLPSSSSSQLTIGQQMNKVFRPNEVPECMFSIEVQHPSIIQLDHPKPISFTLHAVTKLATPSIQAPPIKLVGMNLYIHSATDNWDFKQNNNESTSITGMWRDSELAFPSNILGPDGLSVPISEPGSKHRKKHAVLDIGEVLGIRISSKDVSFSTPASNGSTPSTSAGEREVQTAALKYPLYPSFTTRYVTNKHQLVWKFKIVCGGERQTVRGTAPITVLGSSKKEVEAKIKRLASLGIKDVQKVFALVVGLATIGGSIAEMAGTAMDD